MCRATDALFSTSSRATAFSSSGPSRGSVPAASLVKEQQVPLHLPVTQAARRQRAGPRVADGLAGKDITEGPILHVDDRPSVGQILPSWMSMPAARRSWAD